jgi:hypothetical protein
MFYKKSIQNKKKGRVKMNVRKKVFVLALVFGMSIFFTSKIMAIDVFYAPLEDFSENNIVYTYVYFGSVTPISTIPTKCIFHSGIPHVIGKVGYALLFNGSRCVEVPHNSMLDLGTGDFAITCWVKTKATKRYNTIIEKRKSSQLPGYHVTLYKGTPLLHLRDAPGQYGWRNYFGSTPVNDGKWHYVAIYVDRDNTGGGKIYVDEMCVHTFDPTSRNGSLDNTEPLLIGKHIEWDHAHFEGALDELRIFRGRGKKAPLLRKARRK